MLRRCSQSRPSNDFIGKKIWMRPGRRLVFGRTKSDEIGEPIILSHKTISRKHLTVEVSQPNIENCQSPQTRSTITIRDFDTKIGTILNDVQVRGETLELKETHNSILLGRYEQNINLNWIPVVLTLSLPSKENKTNSLMKLYKIFNPLDIKILVDYESKHTTHVVARKRNTAKGLQALIEGKYLVYSDTFIDALVRATFSKDGNLSPLEVDFDENFPNPLKHLPPKGDEPTQREETAYNPDFLRKNVFHGYIFVFYEKRQYENLLPPITAGCGKAVYQVVEPFQDTFNEFTTFVKMLASEKKQEKNEVECESKRVIVVRFNPAKGPESDWYAEFGRNVALELNQRLVEQNEFLNAILANDASVLISPLQVESLEPTEPPYLKCTSFISNSRSLEDESIQEIQPRIRSRRTIRPKFTGFDDDFSGPIEEPTNNLIESNIHSDYSHIKTEMAQSQSLFVSQNIHCIPEEPNIQVQDSASQKRKATNLFERNENEEQKIGLASTSHQFKRRRLENQADIRKREDFLTEPIKNPMSKDLIVPVQIKKFPPKKCRDIDAEVEQIFVQKRERDEASKAASKSQAERESLYEELDGLEIRNKIQIGEARVKDANQVRESRKEEDSARCSNPWNGRKNFKKFRQKGVRSRTSEKVIVQLEEAYKNDSRLFDDHLDNINSSRVSNTIFKDRRAQEIIQSEQRLPSLPPKNYLNEPKASKSSSAKILANENNEAAIKFRNQSDISDLNITSPTKILTFQNRHSPQILSHSLKNLTREDRPPSSEKSLKRTLHVLGESQNPSYTKKSKFISSKERREDSDQDESEDELKFRFKNTKR
ncbi:putative dna damage response protein [Golovinomyces cichoracearum]|uniref:Putative dna damage response protein n=1 Tax=Golovinomyces cichoracearum TaxID=62708 RepID=A0A420IIG7_9PEZI|nr:putative dna damage response protein [Golovinomyces cichoracearum]